MTMVFFIPYLSYKTPRNPTYLLLISRIQRLLSLLLHMRPLHLIRLTRIPPHILPALLRLLLLRRPALTRVTDWVLN